MAKQKKLEEEGEKTYKNAVVFLRKSKAGNHLFVHDSTEELICGGTLIMNVSDVKNLIGGSTEWIKVSVLKNDEGSERN